MVGATSIMRAQQLVLSNVDAVLRPFDLTFARYEALVLLSFTRTGALPLGKMGKRLMVHPASVTNAVDRLESQGLVQRIRHPTDRRTVLAEITPEGRQKVLDATAAVTESQFGLGMLGPEELDHLARVIQRVRAATGDFDDADDAA